MQMLKENICLGHKIFQGKCPEKFRNQNLIKFNFVFANSTIWSCIPPFFLLITDLYFIIPEVIAQIFNPTEELLIPIEIPTNEGNAEIETQPLRAETKIRESSN